MVRRSTIPFDCLGFRYSSKYFSRREKLLPKSRNTLVPLSSRRILFPPISFTPPKNEKERQYIRQLKNAPIEAQLIKLCDISSNLGNLKNSSWSKTRMKKYVNKKIENLKAIKLGISQQRVRYPRVEKIIDAINEILIEYNQKLVIIQ